MTISFRAWLAQQHARQDSVGELSRFAALIPPMDWPTDNMIDHVTDMFEAHRELSTTYMKRDQILPLDTMRMGIGRAWHEYRMALQGQPPHKEQP